MDQFISNLSITASPLRYGVVVVASVIAGITDAYAYRISNRLTIPLLLGGLGFHAIIPGAEGFSFALLGAFCGLAILMPIYILGGIGAGDVKLLSGIGAWIGVRDFVAVFFLTALLSGAYSVVLMIAAGTWKERMANLPGCKGHRSDRRQRIEDVDGNSSVDKRKRLVPFASLVALAVLILLFVHACRAPRQQEDGLDREEPVTRALESLSVQVC